MRVNIKVINFYLSGTRLTAFTLQSGFDEAQRHTVARLYWQAFSAKLGALMGPSSKALEFFEQALDPEYAISATAPDGTILGVAGFKTANGSLAGGGLRDLAATYGWIGTLWRVPLLALLERDLTDDCLLMDGIFVEENARGMGVGSSLLDAIKAEAVKRDLSEVRLDVIDTNPRARALYEHHGFVAGETQNLGVLRHLFKFSSSVTMRFFAKAN